MIGNHIAGADRATSEILDTFRNAPQRIETIVFSARDYNLKSTDGNIFSNSEALSRLKRFLLNIIKRD